MSIMKYTGYHGTKKYSAERIMKTNFIIKHEHQGWLGTGIYFFEDNYERATDYAEFTHRGNIIEVIKVLLEVPLDKVFDTTKKEHEDEFHEFRNAIVESNLERGMYDIKFNNSNDFDGKVYNAIPKVRGSHLIRAKTFTQPYIERGKGFPISRVPNAVELCLKKANYVKSKVKVKV